MSAPQYCNRANTSHNNHKFGHSLRPHSSPRGGHLKKKILIDSQPYSQEIPFFTFGAPQSSIYKERDNAGAPLALFN